MRQLRRSDLRLIRFVKGELTEGSGRRLIARSRMLMLAPARINRSLSSVDITAAARVVSCSDLEAAEKSASMCAAPGVIIAAARVRSPVSGAIFRQAMR